jgi:hypothetical protein
METAQYKKIKLRYAGFWQLSTVSPFICGAAREFFWLIEDSKQTHLKQMQTKHKISILLLLLLLLLLLFLPTIPSHTHLLYNHFTIEALTVWHLPHIHGSHS